MKGKSAFTLVELLLASAIGVLIIGAIVGVVATGFRAFTHLSKDVVGERDVLAMLYRFEQDVSCAVNTPEKRFSGNKTGFNLVRLYTHTRSRDSVRLHQITWQYDTLSRRITRTVYDNGEAISTETFSGIKSFSISYAGDGEWAEEWNREKLPGIVQAEINGMTLRTVVMSANYLASSQKESRK